MVALAFFTTLILMFSCFLATHFGFPNLDGPQASDNSVGFAAFAFAFVPVMVATFFAAQVFRGVQPSRPGLFHTCFFSGLALLFYSLWATIRLYRIFETQPQFAHGALLTFGLFTFCMVIPTALLLLSTATALSAPPQKQKHA
jgi:hypothetical protein